MDDLRGLAMAMLWLVALYLLATNAVGVSQVLKTTGETWFSGIKTLQGR